MAAIVPFRFDVERHEYTDLETGEVRPSATQLLEMAGLTDPRWYTPDSRERGHQVHRLAAAYDLGAMENPMKALRGNPYENWVWAWISVVKILKPTWLHIERPLLHPHYRYGVTTDRVATMNGTTCVIELKSGAPEPAHRIQTALEAMAEGADLGIDPAALPRFLVYVKANGRFRVDECQDTRDFDKARRILKEYLPC